MAPAAGTGLLRRRSMADGKKVAGVVRAGSPGHDFQSESTGRERETRRVHTRVKCGGRETNVAVLGGTMPAASELAARAPGSLKLLGKRTGRERR